MSNYGNEIYEKLVSIEQILNRLEGKYPLKEGDKVWSEKDQNHITPVKVFSISDDAYEVNLEIDLHFSEERIIVKGYTTLFDGFKLVITCLFNDSNYREFDNVVVKEGEFTTIFYPGKLNFFKKGLYTFRVVGGIPAVQSLEIQKKTGIEYENIKGKIVEHKGSSSRIKYEIIKGFEVDD